MVSHSRDGLPVDVIGRARGLRATLDGPALGALLVIAIVSVAARIAVFGNPLVHVDEEFYRLIGDRMLSGAIPYVDIWDRKPIGLFVLFAALRMIAGPDLWIDNVVALGVVMATALVIFILGRRISTVAGGLVAAVLYVLFLDLAGGEACQAPVWYNLPVALAIAIIVFARTPIRSLTGDFRRPGIAAMLLFGIAMQIKYNAVFEGVFAGLALVLFSRNRGRAGRALALDTALWTICGLAPTLLAAAVYLWIGHIHEWVFANFVSILERGHEPLPEIGARIAVLAALIAPLALSVPLRRLAAEPIPGDDVREDLRFVEIWALVALVGVIVFGTWYNHYALPLFVPLSILAAPLATSRAGRLYLMLLLPIVAISGQLILHRHDVMRGNRALLDRVTVALAGHRGCIFVYDGLVAAYESSNSCLPATRIFPNHFAGVSERGATGIDEVGLVRDVMARHPDRVTSEEPAYRNENPASRAALYAVLDRDYHPIDRIVRGERSLVVYALNRRGPIVARAPAPGAAAPPFLLRPTR